MPFCSILLQSQIKKETSNLLKKFLYNDLEDKSKFILIKFITFTNAQFQLFKRSSLSYKEQIRLINSWECMHEKKIILYYIT